MTHPQDTIYHLVKDVADSDSAAIQDSVDTIAGKPFGIVTDFKDAETGTLLFIDCCGTKDLSHYGSVLTKHIPASYPAAYTAIVTNPENCTQAEMISIMATAEYGANEP